MEYFKATWNVYLVCMKQEIDDNYPEIFKVYKDKFLTVKKVLKGVSYTVKTHCVTGTYNTFLLYKLI